jgi:2,4-dienoyl-CoA reductase-like NADH-dependent reductase (Old Yellow Enzyme family)
MPLDAFAPAHLADLSLRNRVIKTATYEGMCPEGMPSDALVEHHRELAGGVGLTTVAYCAVSPTPSRRKCRCVETVAPSPRHRRGAPRQRRIASAWALRLVQERGALDLASARTVAQLEPVRVSAGRPLAVAMNARGLRP